MNVAPSIIENTVFAHDEAYLDMLGKLFIYYKLHDKYGWTFAEFVYKYDRGIYDHQFPYTYVSVVTS